MSAIEASADGEKLFVALEDAVGRPIIQMASRDDLATWAKVYEPGEGAAANVKIVIADADRMIFYGNFGSKEITTDAGTEYSPRIIVQYTISTDTILDISPGDVVFGSPTEKTCNALAVNPSDPDEIWATVDGDEDLRRTFGVRSVIQAGGPVENEWETLDASLGFDATALVGIFDGEYSLDEGYVAGDNGSNLDLMFSHNEFSNSTDLADATLGAADDISGVEVTNEV